MYLVILTLPLLGALVSGLLGRKVGVTGSQVISTICIIITTLLGLLAFYEVVLCDTPVSLNLINWIDSQDLNISWGFHFDGLTVYFVVISFFFLFRDRSCVGFNPTV